MTDYKKLVDELRRTLRANTGHADTGRITTTGTFVPETRRLASLAALDSLEAILDEVGGLPGKWDVSATAALARGAEVTPWAICLEELRVALEGGEGK